MGREISSQRIRREAMDQEELPEVNQIRNILDCQAATATKAMILAASDPDFLLTAAQAHDARDYLMTRITIENVTRPGVVEAMTLATLSSAVGVGDVWSLTVLRHKTSKQLGASHPTMSEELYQLVLIYINHIRDFFANDSIQPNYRRPLFLTHTGREVESSYVGNRIKHGAHI